MAMQCARNRSEKDSTRGRTLTLERRVFATVATAEQIVVDGGGDQQRETAGNEEDDPETHGGRAG